jgi:hypothetical protein
MLPSGLLGFVNGASKFVRLKNQRHKRLKGVGMYSGAFGSMFVHVEQHPLYCPRCQCDVNKYMDYVGTTTCTATIGRGSRQERESYHKLYGELLYEVPHYTEGTVRIKPTAESHN